MSESPDIMKQAGESIDAKFEAGWSFYHDSRTNLLFPLLFVELGVTLARLPPASADRCTVRRGNGPWRLWMQGGKD